LTSVIGITIQNRLSLPLSSQLAKTLQERGVLHSTTVNKYKLRDLESSYQIHQPIATMVKNPLSLAPLCLLVLAALLSSSVASSFVPGSSLSSLLLRESIQKRNYLFMSGGSDEEAQNVPAAEEAYSPPPESVQPETASQTVEIPASKALLGPKAPPPGFLRKTFPGYPWHQLPNLLTYVRCLAIPVLVGLFYVPDKNVEVGFLFAIASFTDWLDGYLARRWDITSAFGAFLDPVADKLMVSTAMILLAGRYGAQVAIPTCIILAREIAVSALREWMAQRGQRDLVKVGMQGKVKTALTMVALTVLLFVPTNGAGLLTKLLTPGLVMLYMSTLVTVTSGSVYFIAAAPLMVEKK
jgi:CDP-diacylglycerol--glycerol-3-phosphate 3-phosphatidyltransferase